ncbi:hypothetical protein BDY24DRAFT_10428 [Mrakia frigida]|uniref:uncharacterized protein n=1 Tax=Mrakia frigida TaxID=29902 RepID=UPI003FCBFEFA
MPSEPPKPLLVYLGPPGTYTHQAAFERFGDSVDYEPRETIKGEFGRSWNQVERWEGGLGGGTKECSEGNPKGEEEGTVELASFLAFLLVRMSRERSKLGSTGFSTEQASFRLASHSRQRAAKSTPKPDPLSLPPSPFPPIDIYTYLPPPSSSPRQILHLAPLENSKNGIVLETLDLLLQPSSSSSREGRLIVREELRTKVQHCLVVSSDHEGVEKSGLEGIEWVRSHEQVSLRDECLGRETGASHFAHPFAFLILIHVDPVAGGL